MWVIQLIYLYQRIFFRAKILHNIEDIDFRTDFYVFRLIERVQNRLYLKVAT